MQDYPELSSNETHNENKKITACSHPIKIIGYKLLALAITRQHNVFLHLFKNIYLTNLLKTMSLLSLLTRVAREYVNVSLESETTSSVDFFFF